MKKKIFLSMVVIFFLSSFVFASWIWSPTINPVQPLSPGDWIYEAGIVGFSGKEQGTATFRIIYKGIEEGKVIVECNISAGTITETRSYKLPLDSHNQTILNKGGTESSLLLTVIDKQNNINVVETEYRDNVPLTKDTYMEMEKNLSAKVCKESPPRVSAPQTMDPVTIIIEEDNKELKK